MIPAPEAVDDQKTYVLRGETLRRLLARKVRGIPAEIDVNEQADGSFSVGLAVQRRQFSHPWQPMLVDGARDSTGNLLSVSVRINPASTLLLTDAWNDVATITGIDDLHEITGTDEAVWLRVQSDSDGDFTSATIESGELWTDFPSAWTRTSATGSNYTQTWWQLLAYWRTPYDGERWDARFPGGAYKLAAPTTTNLRYAWDWPEKDEYLAKQIRRLVPWHGAHVSI